MIGQLVEFAVGAGLEATRLNMLKEQCVGPAVEIAQAQGWVSVGRLRTRMGLSLRDARFVLSVACQRGLLYDAPNGRLYVAEAAAPLLTSASAAIIASLHDKAPREKAGSAPEPQRQRALAVIFGGIAIAIVGLFVCAAVSVVQPRPYVVTYFPPTPAPPASAMATADAEAREISKRLDASASVKSARARAHTHDGHASR